MTSKTLENLAEVIPPIYEVGFSSFGLDKLFPKALIQNGWKRTPLTEFNPMVLPDGRYVFNSKDTGAKHNGEDDFGILLYKLNGIFLFSVIVFETPHQYSRYQSNHWEWYSNSIDEEQIRNIIAHYSNTRAIDGYTHYKALKTTFNFCVRLENKRRFIYMLVCNVDSEIRNKLLEGIKTLDVVTINAREDYTPGIYKLETAEQASIWFVDKNDKGFALVVHHDKLYDQLIAVTGDCDHKEHFKQTIEAMIERPLTVNENDIISLFKHINRFQQITKI